MLARPDRTALLDSDGRHRIGEPLAELERDRFELGQVAAGRSVASQVLFEGVDGQLYKSGYAPLADAQGQVVALVAAHGTAPSFASLRDFRNLLLLLAVAGGALGAAAAVVAAVSVTRPLRALAGAARRMGAGDLASPMPAVAGRGEVATLRRTLEETRQALRARDEERETMLAGIAHEVRNPLGAMALYAGALADDLRGRPEAALVARIRSELDGLKRLVEEFLDYARPRPLALEPVEGGSLAEEVRDLCLPVAQARGVALEAGGAGAFEADRHLLRRAALNLVRNALEASPAGRRGGALGARRRRPGGGQRARPRPRPAPGGPGPALPALHHHPRARHRARPGAGPPGGPGARRHPRPPGSGGRRHRGAARRCRPPAGARARRDSEGLDSP